MSNLVFSNMMHRPARTVVSMLGIGLGILLIIFTVGLAEGSLRERAQREASVGAEILFLPSGPFGLSGSDAPRLPTSLITEIENIEGVQNAVSVVQNTVAASDTNITGKRLIDGVNFDEYAEIAGLQVVAGRKFVDGADEIMCDSAWLPLKKYQIGDKLRIYERDFTIVGAYEPGAGGRLKMPLSTMQAQIGAEGKASVILIKVKEGFTPEAVEANLQAKFPDIRIVFTKDLEELYLQSLPALNVFLNVVIGVAGVVSALVILLTMYTTVTERTRQIGIMKSLGMSNSGIAWTIVQESILISLGGIVLGVAATFLLRFALLKWSTLNVQIKPEIVVLILISGLISGVIGALYPALRAARLDAVEALNYD